jgi:tetrapyrrole methylase family protein/MazG family protein
VLVKKPIPAYNRREEEGMIGSVGQQFSDLVDLLAKLRGPNGCPWDSEQTHSSLKRHLLEESYEVLEAIDRDDPKRLKEELGDILLQVLFHAQISSEDHEYTMRDVLESLRDKLVRRHPHVFGDISIKDARDVEVVWERLKQDEGRADRHESLLGDIPVETPALAYSQLIQDRASRSGFDWQSTDGVLEKVAEEAGEFRDASTDEARSREFGDFLMVLVNLGRWHGIHAEDALRQANARFSQRFAEMERLCKEQGLSFPDLLLAQKEVLWQKAKTSVG